MDCKEHSDEGQSSCQKSKYSLVWTITAKNFLILPNTLQTMEANKSKYCSNS